MHDNLQPTGTLADLPEAVQKLVRNLREEVRSERARRVRAEYKLSKLEARGR
jgi:hypothetical protein